MGNFHCDKCGYTYTGSHTVSTCPRCGGWGLADEGCICVCYQSSPFFGGVRTALVLEWNSNCPVQHSSEGEKT